MFAVAPYSTYQFQSRALVTDITTKAWELLLHYERNHIHSSFSIVVWLLPQIWQWTRGLKTLVMGFLEIFSSDLKESGVFQLVFDLLMFRFCCSCCFRPWWRLVLWSIVLELSQFSCFTSMTSSCTPWLPFMHKMPYCDQ